MGPIEQLIASILTPTTSQPQGDVSEIERLRADVRVLKRTVGVLAQLLYENDAFGRVDREAFARRLSAAAREARYAEAEVVEHHVPVGESAYRGAQPGAVRVACSACNQPLSDDDPEMSLGRHGRVCLSCFQRGGPPA